MSNSYHLYYTLEHFHFEGRQYTKFILPSGEQVCVSNDFVQKWVADRPGMMLENALVMLTLHNMSITVEDSNQKPR